MREGVVLEKIKDGHFKYLELLLTEDNDIYTVVLAPQNKTEPVTMFVSSNLEKAVDTVCSMRGAPAELLAGVLKAIAEGTAGIQPTYVSRKPRP